MKDIEIEFVKILMILLTMGIIFLSDPLVIIILILFYGGIENEYGTFYFGMLFAIIEMILYINYGLYVLPVFYVVKISYTLVKLSLIKIVNDNYWGML